MLGVVEPGVVSVLISASLPERFAAGSANIKPRQPTCQSDGPEGVIAERQSPTRTALDFAGGEQDQPEHGLVDLVFRKDPLGDFADQGEADAELVVALRLVKRTEQLRLLNPHQVARFPFEIPDPHVGQKFECRAVAVFQAARAGGYTTHAPRATTEKTNQAIGLAERKGLQDDGFRFAGRHALSARRHLRKVTAALRGNRAPVENLITYHTQGTPGNDCVARAVENRSRRVDGSSRPWRNPAIAGRHFADEELVRGVRPGFGREQPRR